MFLLPAYIRLRRLLGVKCTSFVQCHMGAKSEKGTTVLYFGLLLSRSVFRPRRSHFPKWFRYVDDGSWIRARRQRLIGKRLMVPASEYRPTSHHVAGEFLTKAASAYPPAMNRALAHAMVRGANRAQVEGWKTKLVDKRARLDPQSQDTVVQSVIISQPLRGQADRTQRQIEDGDALGGMRSPMAAVERLGSAALGRKVRAAIEDYISDHPEYMHTVLDAVGKPRAPLINIALMSTPSAAALRRW